LGCREYFFTLQERFFALLGNIQILIEEGRDEKEKKASAFNNNNGGYRELLTTPLFVLTCISLGGL